MSKQAKQSLIQVVLSKSAPCKVSPALAMVPVLGLVLSVVVAHEAITLLEGVAAAVVSAGVWAATRTPRS